MNFDNIYNGILENHCVDDMFLEDILTTLEFRLNKNHYHYDNILKYISNDCVNNQEFIYFESENLLINIRSTVDALLQLINAVYDMKLRGIDISLKGVLKHRNCTNPLKDVFLLHTHPKNHFWNFIYTTRNEIVHEICIKTQFPIMFDETYEYGITKTKTMFINKNGNKEDLLYFYNQCIKLIDDLCDKCLYSISRGLK